MAKKKKKTTKKKARKKRSKKKAGKAAKRSKKGKKPKRTRKKGRTKKRTPPREKIVVRRRLPPDDMDIDESEETELQWKGQRLYVLGFDRYIQHDGVSKLPKTLKEYVDARGGEFPAYMPLPEGPVTFRLGAEFGTGRRVRWNGKENLPDQVLRYVRENGTLPRYSEEIEF